MRPAFTLVELLISLSIFSLITAISIGVLGTQLKTAQKLRREAYLYTEAEALMNQISYEVSQNTLDYEAYYSRRVLAPRGIDAEGWHTPHFGYYALSFYNPGTGGPGENGPYPVMGGYGAFCEDGVNVYPEDCPDDNPAQDQADLNTGSHPFVGMNSISTEFTAGASDESQDMNAFCEPYDGQDCSFVTESITDELILLGTKGDRRTVYRVGNVDGVTDVNRLLKMELVGDDSDSNGTTDSWTCASDYACTIPEIEDFIAVSPDKLTIDKWLIYVTPNEDPYLAFAESDYQTHPQVTIFLTVSLSPNFLRNLLGESPQITLQRTVSTGIADGNGL